jgi:hypothetical protein
MKKIVTLAIASSILLAWNTFADEAIKTTSITSTWTVQELPVDTNALAQKYDTIIRNNVITADGEYNNSHYFTKKIKTTDIVIPDEIKASAKKIYFLVEEGSPIVYFKAEAAMDSVPTTPVTKEYNYRVVNFVEGKTEYTFNSADLVKDFSKDQFKNVTISLVAELSDNQKINLANAAYVNIWDKSNVLETLKTQKDPTWTSYYGYYDTQSLESYLEKLWEKMSRAEYKKVLTNAQTKLKALITKNEDSKKDILASITKESDFEGNIEKYTLYSETSGLLTQVSAATLAQIQKLRSYDLIDWVFNK